MEAPHMQEAFAMETEDPGGYEYEDMHSNRN
jgi:hypothetical protein